MSIAAKRAIAAERRKRKDPNEPSLWRLLFGKKKQAQAPVPPEQKNKGGKKGRVVNPKDPKSKTPAPVIVDEKDYYMTGALPVGAEISRPGSSDSQVVRPKGKSRSRYLPASYLLGPDAPPSKLLLRSESAHQQARRASLQQPHIQRFISSFQPPTISKRMRVNEHIKYNIGFALRFHPRKLMTHLINRNCWRGHVAEDILLGAFQLMDLSIIVLKKPLRIYGWDSEDLETRNLIGGRATIDQTQEATAMKLNMSKCEEGALEVKFPGTNQLRWMHCRMLFLLEDLTYEKGKLRSQSEKVHSENATAGKA